MFGRRRQARVPTPEVPRVSPLTADAITWRDQQIEIAGIVAERYTGNTESLPSLERLDACVAGWAADDRSRVDVDVLVNAIGVALGAHIAAHALLAWVIATDEQGIELALHGEPGDILVHPAAAVAKRITAGESTFVIPLHDSIVAGVLGRRQEG